MKLNLNGGKLRIGCETMFKKLARGSKAPSKYTVEISINSLERLPIQHGKVKVAWGRGLERSGHWHETSLALVHKGETCNSSI